MLKISEFKKNYFREYSMYEKAINYPYDAPRGPFTFKNGKLLKGIKISLKFRIPIISIGSNRSPYQLKNKFGLSENLCTVPVTLYGSEIVYASSISSYGSIPATQWPVCGVKSELNLLWLNESQILKMHLSEGIGIAYDFVELDKQTVNLKSLDYKGPIFAYVSKKGVFGFGNNVPIRLKKILSSNSKLFSLNEKNALKKLKIMQSQHELSFQRWLFRIISDKNLRLMTIKKMCKESIFPKNPPWKIQNVNVIGHKIY